MPSAEHIAESSVFRAALRREKLAQRAALDPEQQAALGARVRAHLSALLNPRPAQTIAFCAPIRGEIDLTALIVELIERGWQAAMPVVEAAAAPMVFRPWHPGSPMSQDRHGIPIPAATESEGTVRPEIVLLPLVAFDAHGYRLGYGGGYFDRTLALTVPRPLAIGVGYELCRTEGVCPQPHDIALDLVVTEAGVIYPPPAQKTA